MNYIIKKGTSILVSSYPHPSQGRMIREIILDSNPFKPSYKDTFIYICHILPCITQRLNIFTTKDLVFQGNNIFDLNVKESNLYAFADAGWYGFKRGKSILIVIPENIASLKIKQSIPKKPIVIPFENMLKRPTDRQSFEEWLEEK